MSVIVAISGGKASAYCAKWALDRYDKSEVILYFNDTRWEHPDLYRFLIDLEKFFNHKIHHDNDGRSPEQLFYENNALANNRMPFCSRILKAERLQKYYKNGDILIFGIGPEEIYRAQRLVGVYQKIGAKTKRFSKIQFPLINDNVSKLQIDKFLLDAGISQPELYGMGFLHNNCSGGCVRAGKKHWKLLYEKLPAVYMDRERVENDIRAHTGKDIHFFKDETLYQFRQRIEKNELSNYYENDDDNPELECIGICSYLS